MHRKKQQSVDEHILCSNSTKAMHRLTWTLGTDIRGRLAADAAFWFALSGSRNNDLFVALAFVTRLELARAGMRNSFRPKYIFQIVEKLAAAGLKDADVLELHLEATRCLSDKNQHDALVHTLSRQGNTFDLHTPRSLLWLWRFSSRLSKARESKEKSELTDYPTTKESCRYHNHCWWENFQDPSRLLVMDIGCGLGVSLLGLASLTEAEQVKFDLSPVAKAIGDLDFAECNYLGADLNSLAIGFARGIAERWDRSARVQFLHLGAEKMLDEVGDFYPGSIGLILIQFPTPFRFQGKSSGNTQLPSHLDNFMISPTLLKRVAYLLRLSGGHLVIQSNCEDVAVLMRDLAVNHVGMECLTTPKPVFDAGNVESWKTLPLRTQQWLQQGGQRATGAEWSSESFLPPRAATETEAACLIGGTPIHRCLLRAPPNAKGENFTL